VFDKKILTADITNYA